MEDKSTEKLKSSIKTLQTIIYILGALIILYLIYFAYKIIFDSWSNQNVVAGGMIAMLGAFISMIGTRVKSIKKEIRRREK
ncbi:MAG: hypothetical protein HWE15_07635 [Algoriphagus sp.]|uniref:hypothetical protein n=1 Tax=Algoriphagus sp. TaxID=1872435 RepID=UPI00182A9947|nr:hypothetical protein [Algoriphagus sp.]NVJ86162.1 hypothetical protein [Algoriphagus sp.]